jgi:predicted RNA-binding Zn-ribbon protein involved in translation (DUF1610 family)
MTVDEQAELSCPGCESVELTVVEATQNESVVRCDVCGFEGPLHNFMSEPR